MKTLITSDWHQPPGGLSPGVTRFIQYGKSVGACLIGAGDLLDIVIYGRKAYELSPTLSNLLAALDGYQFNYVTGNHDSLSDVKDLLQDHPNIIISHQLDTNINGQQWHVEHGDRFSLDWSWLRPFYWSVADTGLKYTPSLWYKFCEYMKWKPSQYGPGGTIGNQESDTYGELTGAIWNNALKYGQAKKTNMVIGHTHLSTEIKCKGLKVLDCGNLGDGSYVEIDGDKAGVKFFTGG